MLCHFFTCKERYAFPFDGAGVTIMALDWVIRAVVCLARLYMIIVGGRFYDHA